jgi:hypothetical protein
MKKIIITAAAFILSTVIVQSQVNYCEICRVDTMAGFKEGKDISLQFMNCIVDRWINIYSQDKNLKLISVLFFGLNCDFTFNYIIFRSDDYPEGIKLTMVEAEKFFMEKK